MYTHALILAALSASALASISLTAYDHTDSACDHNPIGKHIVLKHTYDCVTYEPEQPDAYILATYYFNQADSDIPYNIDIFSDDDCVDKIGTFKQNATTIADDGDRNCYAMDSIATANWRSAAIGSKYHYS